MTNKLNVCVPTLEDTDWRRNPYKNMDRLLAHSFETDFSQSIVYYGQILSMSKEYHRTNDITLLLENLHDKLQEHLERAYEKVELSVEEAPNENTDFTKIYIRGTARTGSIEVPLNYSLVLKDSKLVEVLSEVNK